METLSKKYDPKEVEERWYTQWENKGYFKADPQSSKAPFCMVIPPPNVTGSLHIGHALNDGLQDLIARYKRMKGFDVLWVPGCDHAGIATQNVVEREIAKEGKKRDDLGREKFLERVWQWKKQSGDTIMRQLRRLGASCDWSYERFTMDEGLSTAVQEAFIKLYDDGSIYQGDYIINWCPRCGTALSDIEAEYEETKGKLYHIRYPLKNPSSDRPWIIVATTRPETLMGDTAVCVNPKDERFADLAEDTRLIVPVVGREIPLIRDRYVELDFGTGALKVTPAHDSNDFALGDKYGLERIKIMDPQGIINEAGGPYKGLDRFECRKQIVKDLEKQGLLEKIEDYDHSVSHCYRCHTVVESYLSKQWFVAMKPLAKKALAAVENKSTRFLPDDYTKVYTTWLENIRDWCISRQIWWGHRIPVYNTADGRQAAGRNAAEAAKKLGVKEEELTQDPDVLDTWFSSGLWPFSTLGWPKKTKEMERYYPNNLLVTSWDILFFWVARMSMFGLHVEGEVPFKEVLINSLVADEHGKKMSKSKGNVIDPLTKIDTIGADALRFALFSIETQSRYISLSDEKLQTSRNFMNKIWNAARFMLMNLEGYEGGFQNEAPAWQGLALEDRWILARLDYAIAEIDQAMEGGYHVNRVTRSLYDFVWKELCDQYIEAAKVRLQAEGETKIKAQAVLAFVLERTMRLLHPACPFISEEIWQKLPHEGETLMRASWPSRLNLDAAEAKKAHNDFAVIQEVIYSIRNIRAEYNVENQKIIKAQVRAEGAAAALLEEHASLFRFLAKVEFDKIDPQLPTPKNAPTCSMPAAQIYLLDIIDLEKEKLRLEKEIKNYQGIVQGKRKKLENKNFVSRAPEQVVQKEKEDIGKYEGLIAKNKKSLQEIGV